MRDIKFLKEMLLDKISEGNFVGGSGGDRSPHPGRTYERISSGYGRMDKFRLRTNVRTNVRVVCLCLLVCFVVG